MTHLRCASEDGTYDAYNGGSIGGGSILIDTNSGRFMAPNRYGLAVYGVIPAPYMPASFPPSSSFSVGFCAWTPFPQYGADVTNNSTLLLRNFYLGLFSQDNVLRLRLTVNQTSSSQLVMQKISAEGVITTLFTCSGFLSTSPAQPDKVDVITNYGTTGSIEVFINGGLVGSCSGVDVTTDGVSALAIAALGCPAQNGNVGITYSGLDIDTDSTVGRFCFCRVPTSAGDDQQWTGGFAEVGAEQTSPSLFDTASVAGLTQTYRTNQTIPAGTITKVVSSVQATQGTAPTLSKINLLKVIGGTTYAASPSPVPSVLGVVQTALAVSPATGDAFTTAEVNDPNYQMGYESAV